MVGATSLSIPEVDNDVLWEKDKYHKMIDSQKKGKKRGNNVKNWIELSPILAERVRSYYASEPKPAGGLKQIFAAFAHESGKSPNTVSKYYYDHLRGTLELPTEESLAKKETRHEETELEKDAVTERGPVLAKEVIGPGREEEGQPPREDAGDVSSMVRGYQEMGQLVHHPRVGDVVEVTIDEFAPFGVFGVTEEGHRGLIHLSEIRAGNGWFDRSELEDYFYAGERVKAKVVHYDRTTGKLAFSCKELGGKEKLKHPVPDAEPELKVHFPHRRSYETSRITLTDKEAREMVNFLASQVGQVSPRAERELKEVIEIYGPVKTALRLSQVINRFDKSMAVVGMVRDTLDAEFNRTNQ